MIVSDKLGMLDLVFVVDNTGSMGPYINTVKTEIVQIIRTIVKEELCHRLRLGLVSYRDHPPQEESFVVRKYDLTDDVSQIEKNVLEMDASGGGDGPEAVADALAALNKMQFHLNAAKVAILVGDAPPHGVESSDDWKQCPAGYDWEKEAMRAYESGITIHTVGCYPEIEIYQRAVYAFRKIAELTGGQFFPLGNASALVQLITGIAVEEIDKIAIQTMILEELGIDLSSVDVSTLDSVDAAKLADRLAARGARKRVTRIAAAGPVSSPEALHVEQESISPDDVAEAIRQLRMKTGRE